MSLATVEALIVETQMENLARNPAMSARARTVLEAALTVWAAADPEYKPTAQARLELETLLQPVANTGA